MTSGTGNPEALLNRRTFAATKCRHNALRRPDNETQPLPIGDADRPSAIKIAPAASEARAAWYDHDMAILPHDTFELFVRD